MVEITVEAKDLAPDGFQHLRSKRSGRAVAACAYDLEPALELGSAGQIGDISHRKILDKDIGAAAAHVVAAVEHNIPEAAHLVGTEGERAARPHLHAGPSIVVVRRRDHGHARHVERELGELSTRGDAWPVVMHSAAAGLQ